MGSFSALPVSFSATTNGIRVSVIPLFLEDESAPDKNHFIWAYHIIIENGMNETVQLLKRHWKITDSTGLTQEVKGEGVVGEQPILKPKSQYEYTSGVPLQTPTGFMGGHYNFRTESGDEIEVEIPTFSLDSPYQSMSIN